jgi:recombination protein RecT
MDQKQNMQVEKSGGQKLKNLIASEYFKSQIALALPKHCSPDRFVRVALTTMLRVPKLAECDQNSFLQALLLLSQYGLEPDGRNAHLIPFKNAKLGITECQVIVDYKGLVDLVMRSGQVANIHADVICDADEFDYDRGQITKHRVDFRKPRGNWYAAYCIVRMKDGSEKSEVMGKEDIYLVRDKSHGWRMFKQGFAKQSPWADPQSEPEMAKKTVFRRATKWLKLSSELQDVVEADDDGRVLPMQIVPPPAGLIETPQTEPTQPTEPEDDIPFDAPEETPKGPEPKRRGRQPRQQTAQEPEPPITPGPTQMPVPIEADATVVPTMQQELGDVVVKAGFTWDQFAAWGVESGNMDPKHDFSCFDDLTMELANRLLKARGGLLRQLAAMKEVTP